MIFQLEIITCANSPVSIFVYVIGKFELAKCPPNNKFSFVLLQNLYVSGKSAKSAIFELKPNEEGKKERCYRFRSVTNGRVWSLLYLIRNCGNDVCRLVPGVTPGASSGVRESDKRAHVYRKLKLLAGGNRCSSTSIFILHLYIDSFFRSLVFGKSFSNSIVTFV